MEFLWLYALNIILIVVVVFFKRKDPAVAMAWLLCFIFMPVIGPIIYIIFGWGLRERTKKKYIEKTRQSFAFSTKTKHSEAKEEYKFLTDYFKNTSKSILTGKNSVKTYINARDKYDDLIRDIKNAKETINLLYFIIHNDEIGKEILTLLTLKAKEGVEVRFLYDGFGSILTPNKAFRALKKTKNAKVSAFLPVNIFSYSLINHRNHRKIAIIDGKIAYLGGMNIGDEYMGQQKPTPWRDTHLRIIGEAVSEVQRIFCLDWEFTTGENIKKNSELFFKEPIECEKALPMQIVASGPDSSCDEVKSGFIKMLYMAKEYVYIQTPYFAPDQSFLDAIKTAAETGVDVRLMIPKIPDKKYVYYTTLSYVDELLKSGVKVYLYPGFIHSKTIVSDDSLVSVGTTNIDIRSFTLHFEVNAFIYDSIEAKKHKNIFLKDLEKSNEITKESQKKRGVLNVMKEGFFRLFAPIM